MTDEKMPRRLRISRVGDEVEINSTDPLVSMDGCKYAAADYILATDYDTLRELARFGMEAEVLLQRVYESGCSKPGEVIEHEGLTIVQRCGECLSCEAEAFLAAHPEGT